MLHRHISLLQGIAVDAEARIYLRPQPNSEIKSIQGELTGPHSDYARTLPATLQVISATSQADEDVLAEVFIPDPCFWTPRLPFLYKLKITVTSESNETQEYETSIALKRWHVDQTNWKLDGKRVVLRGVVVSEAADDQLADVRETESMLIVQPPSISTLETASRLGVPLLVDLSNIKENLEELLEQLAWCPAVMAAAISEQQMSSNPNLAKYSSGRFPIGLITNTSETKEKSPNVEYDYLAVEIAPEQPMPEWLNTAQKPVVAIRTSPSCRDIPNARAACDKLQADLAPEFDLAGYFVSL